MRSRAAAPVVANPLDRVGLAPVRRIGARSAMTTRSLAMSPVASTRGPTTRLRTPVFFQWSWLLIAAVSLVLLLAVVPYLRTGHFVDRVRVVNGSEFNVEVDAARTPDDGWMGVGTAINRHTMTTRDVYDLGDVWYFRFTTQDATAQVRVRRADLDRQHWTVHVPAEFVAHLRDAGAAPSPEFR